MRGRPTKDPYTRPATNTLERLHAELGAQILENKAEALKLSRKMLHVEAVIKMLDPAFNLRRIAVKRRQPNPWFHGLPPRRGCPQDGYRAVDGAGDSRAGLGQGQYQYKDSRQGRSGGPDRDDQFVPAESRWEGRAAGE
jgi:hypothetical protein